MTRQENVNVDFPEHIPRFIEMLSGGIFLNKRDERVASFGQFSVLAQLEGCLKFRQADVRRRRWSNFSTLLLFHCDFFFDEGVVTEPRGAAKDDECEQQYEEPLHGWQQAIVTAGETRELSCRREREVPIALG